MTANYFMIVKTGSDLCPAVAHGLWDQAHVTDVAGIPSDLDGATYLWDPPLKPVPDSHVPANLTMPWPGGFCRSVFRVARDPNVVGDDSGNTLGTQVYDHGWVLAERLDMMLQDLYEYDPVWPLAINHAVQAVTGSVAVDDGGRGWYGMTTVSPSAAGTLRQILSGDEGSTRKVATIIDSLDAVPQGDWSTIGSTYNSTVAAIMTAGQALLNALAAADPDTVQTPFNHRYSLAVRCGLAAVGLTPSNGIGQARALGVQVGMQAILAKEAGLIGATFTSSHYTTLTDPIDAVIAMPSGY